MKDPTQMELIGQRVKRLRESLGMSQESLAFAVGYQSRSSINKIELGKTDLSQSRIIDLAVALNTSPRYLLDGDLDNNDATYRFKEFDDWSCRFRDRLKSLLDSSDRIDMDSAGIDSKEIEMVISGDRPLTFDLACDIVDAFGVSFDYMLGREEKPTLGEESGLDEKDIEIISLLSSLSGARRDEGLRYLRYLADHAASADT